MSEQPIEFAYKFCPNCATANPAPGGVPFRCPGCGFSQYFGPVAAVGALIAGERDELLLVRRARDPGQGQWGLPGGFVDQQETVEQALDREVMEETGLRVTRRELLLSYPNRYAYGGFEAPVIDLFFVCQVQRRSDLQLADDELEHHEWVMPSEDHLVNMAFHSNRVAVERWLATFPNA